MTVVKRCLAMLLVVVLAVTVLEAGADAHNRRRHRRQKAKKDKQSRVEERQVSNLGVTIDFEDREPVLPLGGGTLFDDDPDYFSGTITGFKNECQGRILVEVFEANGRAVGSTEASDSGSWSVEAEDPGTGGYFARATRYGTGKGARFACGKGVSNTTNFDDADAGIA